MQKNGSLCRKKHSAVFSVILRLRDREKDFPNSCKNISEGGREYVSNQH